MNEAQTPTSRLCIGPPGWAQTGAAAFVGIDLLHQEWQVKGRAIFGHFPRVAVLFCSLGLPNFAIRVKIAFERRRL